MKNILAGLVFLLSIHSQAKLLIISDIDDTLKRTDVLGTKVGGAFLKNQFTGLNVILKSLACTGLEGPEFDFCFQNQGMMHSHDVQLNYVTGAPGRLRTLGREFLQESDFPVGVVRGRESTKISTKEFKIKTIAALLEGLSEFQEVILLGDNGEHDVDVYKEIEEMFPSRKITTYIHQVYSSEDKKRTGKNLYPGQIAYMTAADLGLSLMSKGLITEESLISAAMAVVKDISSKRQKIYRKVVPKWSRCKEFISNYKRESISVSTELSDVLKVIEGRLWDLCQ